MKKLLAFLIIFFLTSIKVQAQTPTPEQKDLIDKLKQIEIFKEKIASKVSEVRTFEKAAETGTIKSVTNSAITLTTPEGEKKISYSEDTLFFKIDAGIKKEAKASDLKENLNITSFGNLNESKDTHLSKFIYLETYPQRISGKIADLDKSAFTLSIKAKDGDLVIDFEKITKTSIYQKGKSPQKSGFSGFKIGDTVFIAAYPDVKEENRFSALRIIQIPQSTQSIISPTPTPKS